MYVPILSHKIPSIIINVDTFPLPIILLINDLRRAYSASNALMVFLLSYIP